MSEPAQDPPTLIGDVHLALAAFGTLSSGELLNIIRDVRHDDPFHKDAVQLHDIQGALWQLIGTGAVVRIFAMDGTVKYRLARAQGGRP